MVVWVSNLKMPGAGVESIQFSHLTLLPLSIGIDAKLWIDNPNGWPLSGKIISAEAEVFSLDKDDTGGQELHIGRATLPNAVVIATHHNASFNVSMHSDPGESVALSARFLKDCGPTAKVRTTEVAVNLTKATVSFWGRSIALDDLGLLFNATVPCPSVGADEEGARVAETLAPVMV